MTSVLHPVGPEPEQTYWARRLAVLVALVVAVGLVIAVIVNGSSTGSAVSAPPAPVIVPPVVSPTPTPSGSASSSASPSAPGSPSSKPSATAGPTPPAKPTPTVKPKPAGPVACAPAKLRGTLTGLQALKPGEDTTFKLSLINGSDTTCVVAVTPENFELKIYSGTDRIWSTDDCSTSLRKLSREVEAEDAVEWKLPWDGRRSGKGCKGRPEMPRPGTYVATAQLDGAEPVQLRVLLRG